MKNTHKIFISIVFVLSILTSSIGINKTNNLQVDATEPSIATYRELRWNNIDYGGYATPSAGQIPSDGYCCLVSFDGFTSTLVDTTNMATSSFEIGSKFRVNGKSIKDMSGSLIHYHYGERGSLYFYFRDSEIDYTGDYQRIIVEIEEGTIFKNAVLPYVRIRFEGGLGDASKWAVEPSAVKTNVSYDSIGWNNMDYGMYGGKAGLNIKFSANLSTVPYEYNGGIKNRNLKNTTLGEDITYNGTPFKDIANSEIMYYSENRLWLYIPDWTSGSYNYIRINSTVMLDAILPDLALISTGGNWSTANPVNYSSIRWNNVNYGPSDSVATGYKILIEFDTNLSITPDTPSTTNQASNLYDVGNRILINGVPIKDVGGSNICYPSGQKFLYIYVYDANISYSGDYFRPTIYIPQGTLFYNSILPEMTFVFNGVLGDTGAWSYVTSPKEYTSITIDEITWNNTNSDAVNFGEKNGLLLGFSSNLSSNSSAEKTGSILYRNYASTSFGDNLKLNGTSFSSIVGAEIKYYQNNKLWIYAPNMADDYGHYKAELELVSPSYLLDVQIPVFDYVIVNSSWTDFSPATSYIASYVNINPSWNNIVFDAGYGELIINYDKTLGAASDAVNQANNSFEIGSKLRINNVAIKNIPNCTVDYAHGAGRLHVKYPLSVLYNDGVYGAVLTVEPSTKFMSSRLGETTLYYQGSDEHGTWVDSSGILITTLDNAVFTNYGDHYGLKFESRIGYGLYNSYLSLYGKNAIEMGTIILPEENYLNSGASSFADFINENEPSSSTYMFVRNTKLDFANTATAASVGYYQFFGSIIDIKPQNIEKNFIGVGYIKINGTYYFGANGSKSTNCYSTLLEAYRSGHLLDPTPFRNTINLETNSYSHRFDDISAISSNHTISFSRAGKYYVTAVGENITKITVDGKSFSVNIPNGSSIYIYNNNGYLKTSANSSLKWGIGEPTVELFDESNLTDYRNSGENLATLSQAFGTNIARIWVDIGVFTRGRCGLINADGSVDNVEFVQSGIDLVHDVINSYKSRGMEILIFLGGNAYLRSDKILYKNGNWYTMDEAWSQSIGGAPSPVVPYDTEEEYQQWLRTQRYFFDAFLQEFPEIDAIETNNEIDLAGGDIYRPHYSDPNAFPSSATVARWAMDVNKALMDSAKANAPHVVVYSPALTCAAGVNGNPYSTSSFLTSCYQYIDTYGTGNPDDYFTVMNMHPYLFPEQAHCGTEGAYLFGNGHFPAEGYPGEMPYLNAWENSDWDTDWLNYLASLRNIMNQHYDNYKPASFTEWGMWDMEGALDTYEDPEIIRAWAYINNNNRLTPVCERTCEMASGLSYLDSFMYFRMYDYEPTPTNYVTYMRGTYGLVYANKTLKDRGAAMHRIITGSNDHSGIAAVLSNM